MNRQKLQLSAASLVIIMTCSGCISGKPRPWNPANCGSLHPIACDEPAEVVTNAQKLDGENHQGIASQSDTIVLASNESNYHVRDPIQPTSRPNSILALRTESLKAESSLQTALAAGSVPHLSNEMTTRRREPIPFANELTVDEPNQISTDVADAAIVLNRLESHPLPDLDFEKPVQIFDVLEGENTTKSEAISQTPNREDELYPKWIAAVSQDNADRIHQRSESAFSIKEPEEQNQSIASSDNVATTTNKETSVVVSGQTSELAFTNNSTQAKEETQHPSAKHDSTGSCSIAKRSDVFSNPQWLAPSPTTEEASGLPALPLKLVDRGWTIERNLDPANRARQIADGHRTAAVALLQPTNPLAGGGQYASDRNWISPDSSGQFARSNLNQIPAMMASSRQFNSANRPTNLDASIEPLSRGRNVSREFQGYEYDRPDFRQPDHGGERWETLQLNARPNHQPVWIPPVLNLAETKTPTTDSYYTAPPTNHHSPSWQPPLPKDSQEKWIPPRTPSRLQDYPPANPTDRYTDRPQSNHYKLILER